MFASMGVHPAVKGSTSTTARKGVWEIREKILLETDLEKARTWRQAQGTLETIELAVRSGCRAAQSEPHRTMRILAGNVVFIDSIFFLAVVCLLNALRFRGVLQTRKRPRGICIRTRMVGNGKNA